jgi:hypothetical protein
MGEPRRSALVAPGGHEGADECGWARCRARANRRCRRHREGHEQGCSWCRSSGGRPINRPSTSRANDDPAVEQRHRRGGELAVAEKEFGRRTVGLADVRHCGMKPEVDQTVIAGQAVHLGASENLGDGVHRIHGDSPHAPPGATSSAEVISSSAPGAVPFRGGVQSGRPSATSVALASRDTPPCQ